MENTLNATNIQLINSVADFATLDATFADIVFVKDKERTGGNAFIPKIGLTANNGTIYAGAQNTFWEMQYAEQINVCWFGAKGDGTTDDTEAIQNALNTGRTVYFPEPSIAYKVSTIYPLARQVLRGDGMYKRVTVGNKVREKGIIGDGKNAVIKIENTDQTNLLVREVSLFDLNISNNSAPCVEVYNSANVQIHRCRIQSTGTAEKPAQNAIDIYYAWRISIRDCFIAGKNGILSQDNVNGLVIDGNTITGGRSGRAICVEQSQGVSITNNIIEVSLDGIWVSSTNSAYKGNCNGVNIVSNYIEQCFTPIVLGEVSTVFGLTCCSNFIGNKVRSEISAREASISIGRVVGGQISDNSMIIDRGEYPIDRGEYPFRIHVSQPAQNADKVEISRNFHTDPDPEAEPKKSYILSGEYAGNISVLRSIGSKNNFDFVKDYGGLNSSELREYVSEVIYGNVGTPILSWLDNTRLEFGGRIFDVSITDKQGDLTDVKLSLGRTGNLHENISSLDISGNVPPVKYSTYGTAQLPLNHPKTATIYVGEDNLFRVTPSENATGSFRIKIRYRVN